MEFSVSGLDNVRTSGAAGSRKLSKASDKMEVEESKEAAVVLPSHQEMLKRSRASRGGHRR
jgi:hypothetical protein